LACATHAFPPIWTSAGIDSLTIALRSRRDQWLRVLGHADERAYQLAIAASKSRCSVAASEQYRLQPERLVPDLFHIGNIDVIQR
jgi:hypothetical protein